MSDTRIFRFGLGLVIAMLVLAGACAKTLHDNGNQTDDIARLVDQNSHLIMGIQSERKLNTVKSCKNTNREHRAIVGFVTASIPEDRLDDPRVKAYLENAARTFPLLGGATAPRTDTVACGRYAAARVKAAKP